MIKVDGAIGQVCPQVPAPTRNSEVLSVIADRVPAGTDDLAGCQLAGCADPVLCHRRAPSQGWERWNSDRFDVASAYAVVTIHGSSRAASRGGGGAAACMKQGTSLSVLHKVPGRGT